MSTTVLPVRLQEKLTKLIIDLTTWRNASFIFLLVTNVENNMYFKQLTLFAIVRINTDLTPVNMCMANNACRNTCMNIFVIVK